MGLLDSASLATPPRLLPRFQTE